MAGIKFYGSQVGGKSVTSLSYTTAPLKLLRSDIWSAFACYATFPFIVLPLSPLGSGHLCELYPSAANLWDICLHVILTVTQTIFLLTIPLWFFCFTWIIVVWIAVFWTFNQSICFILNGSRLQYQSDPQYAELKKEHEHEQWLFLNGVAVGRNWLENNVNRLALTFGRPVLGVHNRTNGILFDVIQCLIQRNFYFATQDIRDGYKIVKETLYKPEITKVVFILHSQGGIEGGMIIDWLLQEMPQDTLGKLEVYTFGNAANHFNNPHLHLMSLNAALSHPNNPSTTKITTKIHFHESPSDSAPKQPRQSHQNSSSGKTIRHIEHYAHTSDFVARWGVLKCISDTRPSLTAPRYMGRVFVRSGEGHQFNQHYLDSMFPLKKSSDAYGGIGGSGFEGASNDSEFMESIIELGKKASESVEEREGLDISSLQTNEDDEPLSNGQQEVLLQNSSPTSGTDTLNAFTREFSNGRGFTTSNFRGRNEEKVFKVKELSRLWLYRNGRSPKADDIDAGLARMSTI